MNCRTWAQLSLKWKSETKQKDVCVITTLWVLPCVPPGLTSWSSSGAWRSYTDRARTPDHMFPVYVINMTFLSCSCWHFHLSSETINLSYVTGPKLYQNRKCKHFSLTYLPETFLSQLCKVDLIIILATYNYLLCILEITPDLLDLPQWSKSHLVPICLLDSKLAWMKSLDKYMLNI